MTLVDGGVYDNLGLEWFQGWRTALRPPEAIEPTFIVIANASVPLVRDHRPMWGARAWNRVRKIQYSQTQATRVRWLVDELEGGRRTGSYLGITGNPRTYRLPSGEPIEEHCYDGALPNELVPILVGLRTDLNRFSPTEIGLLAYHGYWSTHARFSSLHPHLAVAVPGWRDYAELTSEETAALVRELGRRRHRRGAGDNLR